MHVVIMVLFVMTDYLGRYLASIGRGSAGLAKLPKLSFKEDKIIGGLARRVLRGVKKVDHADDGCLRFPSSSQD